MHVEQCGCSRDDLRSQWEIRQKEGDVEGGKEVEIKKEEEEREEFGVKLRYL